MKNGRFALAILVACAFLFGVWPAVSAQEALGVFDLAIVDIETQPFAAGIGDETTTFVTFQNLHTTPVPPDLLLDLVLTVTNAATNTPLAVCRQPVDVAYLTADDKPERLPFPDCRVILQDGGTHLLRAEFVPEGMEATGGLYTPIPNDINPANNGNVTTLVPVVQSSDADLPTELTRIFAGLALFFAVMALVAAGAEVAIDSMKVGLGLKRKVTSMEALERMEKYLPGQLSALSVSATSREQFQRMIQEMRRTMDVTLQNAQSLADIREQIAGSDLGVTFRKANELIPARGAIGPEDLYSFKKYLQAYTNKVLNMAESRLHLAPEGTRPLRDQLAQEISMFDGNNPQAFLADYFEELQDAHYWSTQLAEGWLKERQETFFDQNGASLTNAFEADVRPLLLTAGFAPAAVTAVNRELASRLSIVEAGISQSSDVFVTSVRNVLDAVEMRRYETQSPSRKAWRVLRAWRGGVYPPTRLRNTFTPALYTALFLLYLGTLAHWTDRAPLGGLLSQQVPMLEPFPWLSWLILLTIAAYPFSLAIYLWHAARGSKERPWFIGMYGAAALSLLISSVLTVLVWILQPVSDNRVSGDLSMAGIVQPWWAWLVAFGVIIMLLLMALSLLGERVYDRLESTAVSEGRLLTYGGKLDQATIILRVETLWNLLRNGFDITKVDPDRFSEPETVFDYEAAWSRYSREPYSFSGETAAQFIMQRSDQQRDEESSRLRLLRVISIIVGLLLAYSLQIDVLNLLGEAFPDVLNQLNWTIVSGETLHAWRSWFPADKAVTVGIVLTAFAASAGSAFWHDRLDQLQASKKGAQAAAQLLSQASQVANTADRNDG
jgi:hypothetical protein